MSKTEKEPVKAEEKVTGTPAAAPAKAPGEPKFPYKVLKANCVMLFGVTSSTFIGATIGKESGNYTVAEMKQIIDGWLNKPINLKEEKK